MRTIVGTSVAVMLLMAGSAARAADKHCTVGKMLELPVTMIDRQPTVQVELDGHTMRLVADSGAFFSSLSPGAAAEFGFKQHGAPFGLRLSGVGGDVYPTITKIDAFKLGGITLHDVEFLVGGSEVGPAGLLGQNILGVADVEYDLANGVVRLMKPDNCRHANLAYWAKDKPVSIEEIKPADTVGMHTQGVVVLNGVRLNAMFDTGAATSILSRRAAARVGIKPGDPGVVEAGITGGIGQGAVQTWIASFDSLQIGDNETIRKIRLRFGDLNESDNFDMLIGADFFLSHRVYVSNALRKMFFTYNGGPVFDLSIHHDGKGGEGPELTSAAAYSNRGMASAARHDYARALGDLTHAVTLAPDEARYYYQRAKIEFSMKDDKAAAADLDAAITRAPQDAEPRLARAWLRLGDDKAGARADADAADRALAGPSDRRLELGGLYGALDQPQQALRQYGLWIDAHPHDSKLASAFNDRCWLRATRGEELDAAIDDCNHALRLRPHDPDYLDSRALAYLRRGDFKKAIDDYDDALKAEPKLVSSLYGRGVARRRLGQTAAGDADIAAAKAIDADRVEELQKDGVKP
ncbi:MAG TPA: aspartyl protease family protein [Sphingomonas sp.]|nr:aspartyl protease family protein [Sphingomonas sp.]